MGGALLATAGAVVQRVAARRWAERTETLTAQLLAAPASGIADTFGGASAAAPLPGALPEPVQRYFSASIPVAARRVRAARLASEGTFRLLRPTDTRGPADGWAPFHATQIVTVDPPGLLWVARMHVLPLLPIDVRDGYVQGRGSTEASLLQLIPVASEHDTPELNAGALLRWLAEAVWVPTALLPGPHVRWSALDDLHARATVRHENTEVSAEFTFSPTGDVMAVEAERHMGTDSGYVRARWRGRFWGHQNTGGVRIPLEGEVAWFLNGEFRPYWRGRVVAVSPE